MKKRILVLITAAVSRGPAAFFVFGTGMLLFNSLIQTLRL